MSTSQTFRCYEENAWTINESHRSIIAGIITFAYIIGLAIAIDHLDSLLSILINFTAFAKFTIIRIFLVIIGAIALLLIAISPFILLGALKIRVVNLEITPNSIKTFIPKKKILKLNFEKSNIQNILIDKQANILSIFINTPLIQGESRHLYNFTPASQPAIIKHLQKSGYPLAFEN